MSIERKHWMPSIAVSKEYEVVYILDPESSEEQVTTTKSKYQQIVENTGGTIEKIDVWERRKLAYEIKGRTEGVYVIMRFTGVPKVEAELRRVFQISEDQIRYMIVKPEEVTEGQERSGGGGGGGRYGRNDDHDSNSHGGDRYNSGPQHSQPQQPAPQPAPVATAAPEAVTAIPEAATALEGNSTAEVSTAEPTEPETTE